MTGKTGKSRFDRPVWTETRGFRIASGACRYRERRVNPRAARNVQMNVSLFPRGFSDEVPGSSPPRAPRAQRITNITGTASVDRRGLAWDQKGEINPMAKPKIHVAVGGSKDSCGEPGIGPKNSLILNWSRRRRNYVFITVVGAHPYTENPPRSASRSGVFVAPTRSM